MGSNIINASGSSIPNLIINEIKEIKVTRYVVHDVLAADQDIIQTMGNKNRKFNLSGWAYQTGSNNTPLQTARDDLLYLSGRTGSFSSDIITSIQVFYNNLEIDDKGGRPFEFKFSIDAIEVI